MRPPFGRPSPVDPFAGGVRRDARRLRLSQQVGQAEVAVGQNRLTDAADDQRGHEEHDQRRHRNMRHGRARAVMAMVVAVAVIVVRVMHVAVRIVSGVAVIVMTVRVVVVP